MAYTTIANGDVPDADVLMANFAFLAGGAGIKTGTDMAGMITAAALAPTQPFICIPADVDALLLYCGKATRGPNGNGFVTIISFEGIS